MIFPRHTSSCRGTVVCFFCFLLVYVYLVITEKKKNKSKKKTTLVLKSLFNSEYCKILRVAILENICEQMLLKMCLCN